MAITASAGGVGALSTVLAALPKSFPAPVMVVQHLDPNHRSMLAEIMDRNSALHAVQADEGVQIEPGTVYIAPPDRHMLVGIDGRVRMTTGQRVHFVRPSADILFESVAKAYGRGALAVVLTGSGSDGADGVRAVKEAGGSVIVQDPESSQFPSMPSAAVATGMADHVVPLEEVGNTIVRLLDREGIHG
ncbi:MAG: chemotaxis protein CheB [Acidimicrobiales bacterium]|nr:chemotaxis protein CheB [Acidimicrobiales bacterium]